MRRILQFGISTESTAFYIPVATSVRFDPIWCEILHSTPILCISREYTEIFGVQLMTYCLNSPSKALECPLLIPLLVVSIGYLFDSSACLWWVHVKDINFQIFGTWLAVLQVSRVPLLPQIGRTQSLSYLLSSDNIFWQSSGWSTPLYFICANFLTIHEIFKRDFGM